MANSKSLIYTKVLSESQIPSLELPVGSKVLLEFTTPHLESFKVGLGQERGYLTITSDGYALKIDSNDEEIIEAHKYLQECVNEGYQIRFAPPSDKPIFYVWQSEPLQFNAKRILTISPN